MRSKIVAIIIFSLIFSLLSCSKVTIDNSVTSYDISTASDATITDLISEEVSTEQHSMDYYSDIDFGFDETIKYEEVYNNNDIIVNAMEYVHTVTDCYVKVEIKNNTNKDLVFEEKSYAVNYLNYYGSLIDYKYNDGLDKVTINKGNSGFIKLRVRDVLDNLGYQKVSYMCFLFYVYDKKDKQKYTDIYFDIKTSEYDGIPKYVEYPDIYNDEYFSYELSSYSSSNKICRYNSQINIYNKTNKWYKVIIGDISYNGVVATPDSNVSKIIKYDNLDGDYLLMHDEFYIFPNSKSTFLFELHNNKFMNNNDFNSISKISFSVSCYPEEQKRFAYHSGVISFKPKDYLD